MDAEHHRGNESPEINEIAGDAYPGKGTWVLLKTASPDELYLAFDVETGVIEFFPKTPMEPNDAARALFKAL
jgi:hypothetical protein